MKKTLLTLAIVTLALGALVVGTVYAQGTQPTQNPAQPYDGLMGGRGGHGPMIGTGETGPLHDYTVEALASKLSLTETQVEEALVAGSSMYQIALDNGIAEADIPAFLSEVHAAAIEKAVADGVLTQEQADWMSQRMSQRGYGNGTCLMDGTAPADGTGAQFGRGGMGGGRWQQQTNP